MVTWPRYLTKFKANRDYRDTAPAVQPKFITQYIYVNLVIYTRENIQQYNDTVSQKKNQCFTIILVTKYMCIIADLNETLIDNKLSIEMTSVSSKSSLFRTNM